MSTFVRDLRRSVSSLWQNPGFAVIVVLTMALGIGLNTAIFSVVNAVLLRPLPYPNADRIVFFVSTFPNGDETYLASEIKFNYWRQNATMLHEICGYWDSVTNLTGIEMPTQAQATYLTGSCFRLFDFRIEYGRAFLPTEESPNGPHVVLLSDRFNNRVFGGRPDVMGTTVDLSGVPYTVVGVVASEVEIEGSPEPDVWIPFQLDPNSTAQNHYFTAAARLPAPVSIAQANAALAGMANDFRTKFPYSVATTRKDGFKVERMQSAIAGDVRRALLVLMGAVGLVLLIACANVANLFAMHATRQKHEIAIRSALGASRTDLVRRALTESLVVCLAAGFLGLGLGMIGIRSLLRASLVHLPRIGAHASSVTVDWRVLLFTVAVCAATAILFGLIPSIQVPRSELSVQLREGDNRGGGDARQNRLRSILVVTEIALALMLSIGAGLLIRTFVALQSVNPGFDQHHLLTARILVAASRYETTKGLEEYIARTSQQLDVLPGVMGSAAALNLPLQTRNSLSFIIIGRPLNGPAHGFAHSLLVSPDYFRVLGVPILRGRGFTREDGPGKPGVVVINDSMANQFWSGDDPLRDKIVIARGVNPILEEPPRTIVGVVRNVHDDSLDKLPSPTMYIPISQIADRRTTAMVQNQPIIWIVRSRMAPESLTSAVRKELQQTSGGIAPTDFRSMDEIAELSTAPQTFNMVLLVVFGGAALLLAGIGIYGLLAYSLEQRKRDLAIRLALGARPSTLVSMLLVQSAILALLGVSSGLCGALALKRLISSLLFGVASRDLMVFMVSPLIVIAVALVAAGAPAMRIMRIDPGDILRSE